MNGMVKDFWKFQKGHGKTGWYSGAGLGYVLNSPGCTRILWVIAVKIFAEPFRCEIFTIC